MGDRCDHSNFEDSSLHGSTGLAKMRCLDCGLYFDDSDLTHRARLDAAQMAGPKDGGWPVRYIKALVGLGYCVVPWPAHLEPPHAASKAHPHLKRPDISVELYIVDCDVLRAMKEAIDYAFVYPTS